MIAQPENLEIIKWDADFGSLPPAVVEQTIRYNRRPNEEIMADVYERATRHSEATIVDDATGIETARITDWDCAINEAVLMFNPFGNRVTNSHLVRADYTKSVLQQAGIYSRVGRPLSVMVVGSPSGRSGLKLSRGERSDMATGFDYSPFTKAALDVARRQKLNKLYIMGHSLGGVLALSAAAEAESMDIDVVAVASGDPVCSKPYDSLAKLAADFSNDSEYLRHQVKRAGLDIYTHVQGMDLEVGKTERTLQDLLYVLGVARRPLVNLALAKGMAAAQLESLLDGSVAGAKKTTIGHGTEDQLLANFSTVVEIAKGSAIAHPDKKLSLVEVTHGRHTWGDNIPAVAAFAVRSFTDAA